VRRRAVPDRPAVWVAADRRIREVAPFASYGEFTGYAPRDICSFWPVPATSTPAPAAPAAPDRSSWYPPRTTRRRRTRPAWTWRANWALR
jgi:arylsulfatase A-like enzyme